MDEIQPRLQQKYKEEVVPQLIKELGLTNPFEVPRLTKISVNMGLGAALQTPETVAAAVEEMAAICGQKPVITRAKKAIATFKVREGMPIGVAVTLRRARMWEFADRLFTLALPR